MTRPTIAGRSALLAALALPLTGHAVETIISPNLPVQPTGLINDQGAFIGGAIQGIGEGAVYQLVQPSGAHHDWSVTLLDVELGSPYDGAYVTAPLIKDSAGNIYGTTYGGGSSACSSPSNSGCGTIFKLTRPTSPSQTWTKQNLFEFQTSVNPVVPLAIDATGKLYLPSGNTILMFTPPASGTGPWSETTIYTDRANQNVLGLQIDPKGALYGVARPQTGSPTAEFLYKLTPPAIAGGPWARRVLATFAPSLALGQIALRGNSIFAATQPAAYGGPCDSAATCAILQLSPAPGQTTWTTTTLHSFAHDKLGVPSGNAPSYTNYLATPYLSFGLGGAIYGAIAPQNSNPHAEANATIYKLTKPTTAGAPWTETALYTFTQQPYGFSAGTPMIIANNGTIFGTAVAFKPGNYDNIAFRITQP